MVIHVSGISISIDVIRVKSYADSTLVGKNPGFNLTKIILLDRRIYKATTVIPLSVRLRSEAFVHYCLDFIFAVNYGLMVSALVSRSSGLDSSPGRRHCVVYLGKTLDSHSAYLQPDV